MMSWPQTGHGPRSARGMRTSLSLASSSPTVAPANFAMSAMNALARLLAGLDRGQAVLPVAGQRRRRQRMLAEQADHVQALLGGDQRAAVALDVADVDQALDDRGARRRRADARLLHRLAQLLVVDELARGLHRAEQRRVGVAPRRLGLLLERTRPRGPPPPRPARAWAAAGRGPRPPRPRAARRRPARRRRRASPARAGPCRGCGRCARRPSSRRACSRTPRRGWKTARKRRTTRS